MYRFVADIVNDIALVLDCISPAFPSSVRFALLAFSSILKAIVGFTSGAKASLSQHFAKSGNLAELNAVSRPNTTALGPLMSRRKTEVRRQSSISWQC